MSGLAGGGGGTGTGCMILYAKSLIDAACPIEGSALARQHAPNGYAQADRNSRSQALRQPDYKAIAGAPRCFQSANQFIKCAFHSFSRCKPLRMDSTEQRWSPEENKIGVFAMLLDDLGGFAYSAK